MQRINRPPILYKALEAALDIAQSRAWRSLTLVEIAAHAEIPMADLYGVATKDDITDALDSWADRKMSVGSVDMEDLPRDRLFDVIMRRYEHMELHRPAILSLMKDRDRSAQRRLALVAARSASANWALSCASMDDGSPGERTARKITLAWIIGRAEAAWRTDGSGDFAQTMSVLDEELKRAENRLERWHRFTGGRFSDRHTAEPVKPETASPPEAPRAETDPA